MLNVCKVCKTVKTTQNPVRHCFVPVPDRFSIPLHLKEAATRACLQMRVVWLNMIFIRNLLLFQVVFFKFSQLIHQIPDFGIRVLILAVLLDCLDDAHAASGNQHAGNV